MEKVLFTLASPTEHASFADDLLRVASTLDTDGAARGIQVNVADDAVAPAVGLRIVPPDSNPPVGVVGLWVDSSHGASVGLIAETLGALADEVHAYLVTESIPLAAPDPVGSRSPGFSQMAFLRRRPELSVDEWMRIWFEDHTQLAIDTQDTYLYVQQVIVRALTPGAPPWHGIVEEAFPETAMTEPGAFFDAVDDEERLAAHQQAMFESVDRFLDLSQIQVVPTSRHVISTL